MKVSFVLQRQVALAALAILLFVATTFTAASVASAAEVNCTPSNVYVFSSRVHIRCEETFGGVRFFAAPTTDAAYVARVLSVLSTATVGGRTVLVMYDPSDLSGASIGCATSDCRLIQAVGFWR